MQIIEVCKGCCFTGPCKKGMDILFSTCHMIMHAMCALNAPESVALAIHLTTQGPVLHILHAQQLKLACSRCRTARSVRVWATSG